MYHLWGESPERPLSSAATSTAKGLPGREGLPRVRREQDQRPEVDRLPGDADAEQRLHGRGGPRQDHERGAGVVDDLGHLDAAGRPERRDVLLPDAHEADEVLVVDLLEGDLPLMD